MIQLGLAVELLPNILEYTDLYNNIQLLVVYHRENNTKRSLFGQPLPKALFSPTLL